MTSRSIETESLKCKADEIMLISMELLNIQMPQVRFMRISQTTNGVCEITTPIVATVRLILINPKSGVIRRG